MPSSRSRLQYLFLHYIHDTGTPDEIREFWELFAHLDEDDPVKQDLWRLWHKVGQEEWKADRNWQRVLDQIYTDAAKQERPPQRTHVMPAWIKVAASVLLLGVLSVSAYRWFSPKANLDLSGENVAAYGQDIEPGGNKAMLTLANGRTIILDSAQTGQLGQQGNVTILKVNNGTLAYNRNKAAAPVMAEPQYNVLKTPRGGQYQLVLPDGTKVWLNDSSSLRFPTAFSGKERIVQMTGEAYFEVAPNEAQPFVVQKGGLEIKVLGTHFNVNAYEDESAIKVTLLEGLVKVQPASGQARTIHPGEQLQVGREGMVKVVQDVNEKGVIAWKDNLFWFEDDDIQTVMRQVARWYDVKVSIQGDVPQHFTGSIPRNIMVSGVFEVLKRTGSIHFEIQDKNIIVSP